MNTTWVINLIPSSERIIAVAFSGSLGVMEAKEYNISSNPHWKSAKERIRKSLIVEDILKGDSKIHISTPHGRLNMKVLSVDVDTDTVYNSLDIWRFATKIEED